jgi:type I restriction enzyme S subunit
MKEYSEYKFSGIEWIGDIPKNWNFVSCRLIVSERNERNEGMKNNNYLSLMANIGVIPYEEKGNIGNKKPENLEKCKIVYKGDFIINSMNYYIGSYGISKYDGICSPVYIVLYANTKVIELRFAFRIFENPNLQGISQSFGNGILEHRRAINWDIFKNIKIPIPSLEEQRDILNFLDKKINKIDALISDKEKLIELFKEQRRSIISETVTKGLDKKAEMKPSGIEWIGDIPYNWDKLQVKRLFNVGRGRVISQEELLDDGLYPVFSSQTKNSGCLGYINTYDFDCKQITWTTDGNAGAIFLREGKHNCTNVCGTLQLKGNYSLKFFMYLLQYLTGYYKRPDINGAKIMNNEMARIILCVPPAIEQKRIANFLDDKTEKIDNLIENITKQIKKLQEYRKSIVSEAVTGKVAI